MSKRRMENITGVRFSYFSLNCTSSFQKLIYDIYIFKFYYYILIISFYDFVMISFWFYFDRELEILLKTDIDIDYKFYYNYLYFFFPILEKLKIVLQYLYFKNIIIIH